MDHLLFWVRPLRICAVAALGLFTASCAAPPARLHVGADPSDPQARVPRANYRPVLGGYVSQRPVKPAPWREQNERVAPKPKADQ